jgi:hypothetical protein
MYLHSRASHWTPQRLAPLRPLHVYGWAVIAAQRLPRVGRAEMYGVAGLAALSLAVIMMRPPRRF